MPSGHLTPEQRAHHKARLAEEVERRKAQGNAGRQKSLASKLKELLPSALENIKHVVEGTGDIDKNRYDASKWIVTQTMTTEKHSHELKLRRLAAKKAEAEANAGGYGDNSAAALKRQAEENGGKPKLSTAYNPEWDNQRKITDDIPEDDYEEDEEFDE